MKKTLVVLFSIFLCFSMLVACAEKPVDPSTINLDEIKDTFIWQDEKEHKNNPVKDWWSQKNIEELTDEEQLKLVNDLCRFNLPKTVEIDINTDKFFDSEKPKIHLNATGIADFDEYKTIVAMLRKNRFWFEDDGDYDGSVLSGYEKRVSKDFYNEFICEKNPENMFVFLRYSGPFKKENGYPLTYYFSVWHQTITVIADEETGKCVFNVVGTTDHFK